MSPSHRHRCEWSGVSPYDERVVMCEKGASGFVVGSVARPTYCCDEHVAWAKRVTEGGRFLRGTRSDDRGPPFTHHAMAEQDHGTAWSPVEVY